MNDLPVVTTPTDPAVVQPNTPAVQEPEVVTTTIGGKEGEAFPIASAELPLKAVGQEVDLPKEVQAAGVQVHPTTVALPQLVSDQGVQAVGHNVPATPTSGNSITLPLTEEQIEAGLKRNMSESIRWLAEWCAFHLKKMHSTVTHSIHQKAE